MDGWIAVVDEDGKLRRVRLDQIIETWIVDEPDERPGRRGCGWIRIMIRTAQDYDYYLAWTHGGAYTAETADHTFEGQAAAADAARDILDELFPLVESVEEAA